MANSPASALVTELAGPKVPVAVISNGVTSWSSRVAENSLDH